jgi:hypothetical protein
VLSANGDFTNERVLQIGDGIDIEITDSREPRNEVPKSVGRGAAARTLPVMGPFL